jgi:hypothetical protein
LPFEWFQRVGSTHYRLQRRYGVVEEIPGVDHRVDLAFYGDLDRSFERFCEILTANV